MPVKKHPCPKCGEPAVSSWRKCSLSSVGPLSKVHCRKCGAEIGIPFLPSAFFLLLITFIPFITGFAAIKLFSPPDGLFWGMAVLFLGFLAPIPPLFWLYSRYVPLVVKGI